MVDLWLGWLGLVGFCMRVMSSGLADLQCIAGFCDRWLVVGWVFFLEVFCGKKRGGCGGLESGLLLGLLGLMVSGRLFGWCVGVGERRWFGLRRGGWGGSRLGLGALGPVSSTGHRMGWGRYPPAPFGPGTGSSAALPRGERGTAAAVGGVGSGSEAPPSLRDTSPGGEVFGWSRYSDLMERAYFDHAATTPLEARVLEAMVPALRVGWGNPSGIYRRLSMRRGCWTGSG